MVVMFPENKFIIKQVRGLSSKNDILVNQYNKESYNSPSTIAIITSSRFKIPQVTGFLIYFFKKERAALQTQHIWATGCLK